jgi:hypothetical protein
MPRQWRIEYPGTIYHAMSRGDRREQIFLDDVDRPVCVRHAQAGRGVPENRLSGACLFANATVHQWMRNNPITGMLATSTQNQPTPAASTQVYV